MNFRRISGVILLIGGVCLYLFGSYIDEQVNQGKEQIASGQKKVNNIRGLSSLSPYTKDVGDMVTDSGQKKIDAGKEEVAKYEEMVYWMHFGGISIGIIGALLIGVSFVHKKNHLR